VSQVGRGTRFRLRLGRADAAPAARPAAPVLPSRDLVGLVVAPDAELRQALVHLLEGRGAHVLEADDAGEAASLLDELGILPDFLLADERLAHGGNGLEALSALTAQLGRLPACILTADRSPAFRTTCAILGAGVLWKPLDPAALDGFLAAL
jgi:two-component system, sensor histidine kinase